MRNSGTCMGGYVPENVWNDSIHTYWCSVALTVNANCWIIFDVSECYISKIEITFQQSYACSTVKVYTSDTVVLDNNNSYKEWELLKEVSGLAQDGTVKTIILESENERFIRFKFENWINGYAGVSNLKFYGDW